MCVVRSTVHGRTRKSLLCTHKKRVLDNYKCKGRRGLSRTITEAFGAYVCSALRAARLRALYDVAHTCGDFSLAMRFDRGPRISVNVSRFSVRHTSLVYASTVAILCTHTHAHTRTHTYCDFNGALCCAPVSVRLRHKEDSFTHSALTGTGTMPRQSPDASSLDCQ